MPFLRVYPLFVNKTKGLDLSKQASLINVAIKAREEQINLFFRAVATKRSEVNLKGGLEGLSI